MLAKLRAAGLIVPALAALAALAVLMALGTWQLQRMAWKNGLIDQIKTRTTKPPIDLASFLGPDFEPARGKTAATSPTVAAGKEYTRVRVDGRFLHRHERFLYAPSSREGPGFHVYTPLITPQGDLLLVNRGYIPERLLHPDSRAAGQIETVTGLTGLVRAPGVAGIFTPENNPDRNIWFWRDLDAMAAGIPGRGGAGALLPFSVDAEATPAPPGGWPRGGTTNLAIPNRHFEYALTWFGLAATLIGVFVAFAAGRLQSPATAAPPPPQ